MVNTLTRKQKQTKWKNIHGAIFADWMQTKKQHFVKYAVLIIFSLRK